MMQASIREMTAYRLANMVAKISPFWRFRLWARLIGGNPYHNDGSEEIAQRAIKPHGYVMALKPSDWMERYALRSGRFYQDEVIGLIDHTVKEGDIVLDVGTNIGFVTLMASKRVGNAGHVYAFEPNPHLVSRLKESLRLNNIANVTIFETALGDRVGKVELIGGEHHGTNRISVGVDSAKGTEVDLSLCDDLVNGLLPPNASVMVKIDVEGAEFLVLKGMQELMKRPNTRFFVELGDDHSKIFGYSANDVFQLFAKNGYSAYFVHLSPFRDSLRIKKAQGPLAKPSYDVLFVRH